VDVEGKALYVWLPDGGNPNERTMEVSTRSVLWYGNELTPYVRLRGFRFEHCANRAQWGAIHLDFAHGWVLEDCTVEWTNGTGMKLNDCARITVRRCRFNNNGQLGIGIGDGYEIAFEDCETSYNNWKGYSTGWEAGGVKVAAATRRVRFIRHRSAFNRGSGIWFDYAGYGHEIIGCIIHDNNPANAGIQIEVTFGVLIANNICYRNSLAGDNPVFGSGILLQQSGFCRVYHNICVENDNGLALEGGGRPVLAMGNKVFNNIFAYNREFQVKVVDFVNLRVTGWTFPFPSFAPESTRARWTQDILNRFDYNLYFAEEGKPLVEWGGAYNPGTPDKGQYQDLREFTERTRKHSGWAQEEHGLVADPKFVNMAEGDFRLRPDSPAIDRGVTLDEVKKDITDTPRPKGKAPDIGAYEHGFNSTSHWRKRKEG